jgi:hypothetical protein
LHFTAVPLQHQGTALQGLNYHDPKLVESSWNAIGKEQDCSSSTTASSSTSMLVLVESSWNAIVHHDPNQTRVEIAKQGQGVKIVLSRMRLAPAGLTGERGPI